VAAIRSRDASRTAAVTPTVDAAAALPLPRRVPRPFPAQTVRDLTGIARLLYRTWRAANAGDSRLPELVAIGKDLQASLTMAAASKPGTRRHRQAWELAEVATHRLGGILDAYVAVKPLISAAFSAVDESAEPSEREAKRLARQRR
jgi:hypothetical protein